MIYLLHLILFSQPLIHLPHSHSPSHSPKPAETTSHSLPPTPSTFHQATTNSLLSPFLHKPIPNCLTFHLLFTAPRQYFFFFSPASFYPHTHIHFSSPPPSSPYALSPLTYLAASSTHCSLVCTLFHSPQRIVFRQTPSLFFFLHSLSTP